MNPRDDSRTMSRIGRSYPRFKGAPDSARSDDSLAEKGVSAGQIAGAVVGILCALGLIAWLFSR